VAFAFVLREPHADTVAGLLDGWEADGTSLHAPLLAQYEIASALTRSRVRDGLTPEDAVEALEIIDGLGAIFHPPADIEHVVEIAAELKRHSAYDAAYLALAEHLDADLWTLDGPLARNAAGRYRVKLID
jgi:predicted nucleic acid-binding protein